MKCKTSSPAHLHCKEERWFDNPEITIILIEWTEGFITEFQSGKTWGMIEGHIEFEFWRERNKKGIISSLNLPGVPQTEFAFRKIKWQLTSHCIWTNLCCIVNSTIIRSYMVKWTKSLINNEFFTTSMKKTAFLCLYVNYKLLFCSLGEFEGMELATLANSRLYKIILIYSMKGAF